MSLSQHNNYAVLRLSLHFNCEFVYFFKLASQIQVGPCPGKFHLILTCYETSLSLQNHIHCKVKKKFLWFRRWHVGPEFLITSSRSKAEISTSPGFFPHIMLLTTQMIYGKYVKEFTFTSYYPYIESKISILKFQGRPCLFGLAFCVYVESSIFPWVQRLSQRNPRMQSIRSVTHFLLLDLAPREETREISQGIAWFFTNGI